MRRKRSDLVPAIGFILPNFLGFVVFTAGPVIFSLGAAFSNWTLTHTVPFRWIGLGNFRSLVEDANFHLYLVNTLYLMIGIPITIAGSLVLALLLSQKLKGIVAYRTLFYLPSFTNGIAIMILWKALLNPDFGPVNALIDGTFRALHIHAMAPAWLASTQNIFGLDPEHIRLTSAQFGLGARDAIVMMGVWTAIGGNNMLLYLAALTNVPPELYEAAQIDGAGRWALFAKVTWPSLAPTTFFIGIMSVIGGLQAGFEQARVMTQGGPAGTTTTLAYYIFDLGFQQFKMGYASAVSWILFMIILMVTLINWRLGNREAAY